MASILPAWSRCISLAPAPSTNSAQHPERAGVHHVEEEVFQRRPAAADQLAQPDALANAEPDEASQHPLPRHASRDTAAACCRRGQRMLAARAVKRSQQQHRDQNRRVPPGSEQASSRLWSNLRFRWDLCVAWTRSAPSYNVRLLDFIAGASDMAFIEDVVIVSAVRTPIGKFQGSLSDFTAPQLGAIVVREAVKRAGIDPNTVDECIMGNVVSRGTGTESRAPGRARRRTFRQRQRHDHQQGLRLGIEGGRARRSRRSRPATRRSSSPAAWRA